jgi:hypothetical protein
MHWAIEHVDPMLGLRNAVCNDRWDEAWSQITDYQQTQSRHRQQTRRAQRLAALSQAISDNKSVPLVDAPPQPRPVELVPIPAMPPISETAAGITHFDKARRI